MGDVTAGSDAVTPQPGTAREGSGLGFLQASAHKDSLSVQGSSLSDERNIREIEEN